ncbi:hypothetical protein [Methanochimaera problematica]|nr:hypothetical protein [Methanoplanus sp. FWC-SCC4]
MPNGPSFDIVEDNGYLYVAQGSEVRVYDVTNPEKIKDLTWKNYISKIYAGESVKSLYIQHPCLHIGYATGYIIADIRDPFKPFIISSLKSPYERTEIRDVEVYGNYAYLTVYNEGIQIVDISDVSNPKLGKIVTMTGYNRPWRAFAADGYLYVSRETDNILDIFDISDPKNPKFVGNYTANSKGDSFSGVAVKGNYAYVVEYHNGIRVVNISDKSNPVEVTKLMNIDANDIKIHGNYAYISVRYQGFNVIDISNPKNSFIAGKGADIQGYIEGIFPTGDYTFLAGESMGFGIYDTSNPKQPVLLTKVPVVGGVDSVVAKDDHVFIGAHNDGMWVIDTHDKENPIESAFIETPGRFSDLSIQDNYLFGAGEWGGLNMIDITDPKKPVTVFVDYMDNIGAVLPDGNYIYTSAGIVDIHNKYSPRYISRDLHFDGRLAKLKDNIILVAAYKGKYPGLHVIDVSKKTNPVVIKTYDSGKPFYDVSVDNNIVAVLNENNIIFIDFTDEKNPKKIDEISYKGEWTGHSIILNENIAYAAGGPLESIKVFDFSNPSNITQIDSGSLWGTYNCIDYHEGIIYAGNKFGLSLLYPEDISKELIISKSENFINDDERTGQKSLSIKKAPGIITPISIIAIYYFLGKYYLKH